MDQNTGPFEPSEDANQISCNVSVKREIVKEKDENNDELLQKKKEEKKKSRKHNSTRTSRKRNKTGVGEEIDKEEVTKEKKERKMGDEKSSSQFKKLWKNIKGMEMKNSEMELLASHLDEHTQGTLKSARTLINENIPKIHETFQVIYKFTLTLKKMLKVILYKKRWHYGRAHHRMCRLPPSLCQQLEPARSFSTANERLTQITPLNTSTMKRSTLKIIAPPFSGRYDIIKHFQEYSKPLSSLIVNCNLTCDDELFKVFENPMSNLATFHLLLQDRSLKNYEAGLKEKKHTLILDHTPLELVKLHTVAYAQTRLISNFCFELCSEMMKKALENCATLEEELQCDVAYIYLNVPPEMCYNRMRNSSWEDSFMEEAMLHNLAHLIRLHSEMNPGKKLILDRKNNVDFPSEILNFYLKNIVDGVCKLQKKLWNIITFPPG